MGWWSWLAPPGTIGRRRRGSDFGWFRLPTHNLMSDTGCRRGWGCRCASRSSRRNHCNFPGGDPRMRLEGFSADFVSTLVNDSGRGDVETRCFVYHIPANAHAQSNTHSLAGNNTTKFYHKSYLAWLTPSIFLYQLYLNPTPYLNPDSPVVRQRKPNHKVLKDLGQRKRIDWPETI